MCILGPNSNGVAWGRLWRERIPWHDGCEWRNHTNQLYYNTGNSNHSITVKCVGDISNRSAIGAKLIITADIFGEEVQQLYEISSQSGGGYGSQNSMQTVVGLGDATFVKKSARHLAFRKNYRKDTPRQRQFLYNVWAWFSAFQSKPFFADFQQPGIRNIFDFRILYW